MDDQKNLDPNEPARSEYTAPRAQRLSDAVQASGDPCESGSGAGNPGSCVGDGSGAYRTCVDGGVADACQSNGTTAVEGCWNGTTAGECVTQGSSAI